jgi:hypothetical protein
MAWLGWVVAGVLLLGVGGSAVAASLASHPREPQAGAAVVASGGGPAFGGFAHRGRGRWGARAPVRGEVTVPREGNTFEQIVFARGMVTEITETSLSITSADGHRTTFTLNGDTRYRRGRDQLQRTDVVVGAQAFASGPRSGQTITARRVLLQPERRRGRQGPTPTPSPTPTPGPTTTT